MVEYSHSACNFVHGRWTWYGTGKKPLVPSEAEQTARLQQHKPDRTIIPGSNPAYYTRVRVALRTRQTENRKKQGGAAFTRITPRYSSS